MNENTLEELGIRSAKAPYAYPYGFIMNTSADDGDGVDCYVIIRTACTYPEELPRFP